MAVAIPALIAGLATASAIARTNYKNEKEREEFIAASRKFNPDPYGFEQDKKNDMERATRTRPAQAQTTRGGSVQKFNSKVQRTQKATRTVRAPSTIGGISRNLRPLLSGNGAKLVISHCEPFQSQGLTAAGVLNTFTTAIIPSVMPYLNGIAANFGKYRWLRLLVYYVPACPTSTSGEMAFGQYFDRADATAFTFLQAASLQGGVSFAPWMGGPPSGANSVNTSVDCTQFDKPRYPYVTVANFTPLSASDQNNYCPVNLAFASQGSTAAVSLAGRFWCAYSVELSDPIVAGINA